MNKKIMESKIYLLTSSYVFLFVFKTINIIKYIKIFYYINYLKNKQKIRRDLFTNLYQITLFVMRSCLRVYVVSRC